MQTSQAGKSKKKKIRHRRRVTPTDIAEMQRLKASGVATTEICKKLGRDPSVIARHLARVPTKAPTQSAEPRPAQSADLREAVRADHADGVSWAELMSRHKITRSKLRLLLEGQTKNYKSPHASNKRRPLLDSDVAEIVRLRGEGLTQQEIANETGRARSLVYMVLKRAASGTVMTVVDRKGTSNYDQTVIEKIKKDVLGGETYRIIGERHGVHPSTVGYYAKQAGAQRRKGVTQTSQDDLVATTNAALARVNGTAASVAIASPVAAIVAWARSHGVTKILLDVKNGNCVVEKVIHEEFTL